MTPTRTRLIALLSTLSLCLLVAAVMLIYSYHGEDDQVSTSDPHSGTSTPMNTSSTQSPEAPQKVAESPVKWAGLDTKFKVAIGALPIVILLLLAAMAALVYLLVTSQQSNHSGQQLMGVDEGAVEKAAEERVRKEYDDKAEQVKEAARQVSMRSRIIFPAVVFVLFAMLMVGLQIWGKGIPKQSKDHLAHEDIFLIFGALVLVGAFIASLALVETTATIMGVLMALVCILLPSALGYFNGNINGLAAIVAALAFIIMITIGFAVPLRQF